MQPHETRSVAGTLRLGSWAGNYRERYWYNPLGRVVRLDEITPSTELDAYLSKHGPQPGEFRSIAVFPAFENGEVVERLSHRTGYSEQMMIDALSVDFRREASLVDFVRRYGHFTAPTAWYALKGGAYNRDGTVAFDNPNDRLVEVEPIWLLARRLAVFRITYQILNALKRRSAPLIKSIVMVSGPETRLSFLRDEEEYTAWPVRFAPAWLPVEMRQGLGSQIEVDMDFEPLTAEAFLLAGWRFVAQEIGGVLAVRGKHLFHVAAQVPNSILKADPHKEWHASWGSVDAAGYADNREVSPPMFRVDYSVGSREELLYVRMLDMANSGAPQRVCAICGESFVPESGRFKYCPRHNETDKKRWRRQQVRSRA